MTEKINKTEDEWKTELTPEQYRVLRKKGTEAAFTGKYHDLDADGMYRCAACGQPFFPVTPNIIRERVGPAFTRR